jgi:hypothetical protein
MITRFGSTRLRPALLSSLLVVAMLAGLFGASIAAPSESFTRPEAPEATATIDPNLQCFWTFTDDFPLNDPNLTGDFAEISVGPEPYTAGYYPIQDNGVRLRSLIDPLRPGERASASYSDIWAVDSVNGMRVWGDGDGAHIGGTGTQNGGTPHVNYAGLYHALPQSQQNPGSASFLSTVRMRLDETAGIGANDDGNGNITVYGVSSEPAHNGHPVYFAGGFGRTPAEARFKFVDGRGDPWVRWSHLFGGSVTRGDFYDWRMSVIPGVIHTEWNGQPADYSGAALQRLDGVGVTASVRYRNLTLRLTYSDFRLEWITLGRATSVNVPLPLGAVQYGLFDVVDDLGDGNITYYAVGAGGTWVQIQPGQNLSQLGLAAPIRLQARLVRPSFDSASPVLREWRVQTCRRVTPTPTATATRQPPTPTGTPRPTNTPTPPNTPRPSSTPRPTITPGAYFQIAPLRGYVHLKVSPVLDPPAWPHNETDWKEDEPMYYRFQVYAGLVPSAFVDPSVGPPRLCYWASDGWVCVPGQVRLESYRLTGIIHENINFLQGPQEQRPIPYAFPHQFGHWDRLGYRYVESEYTWVNWLAPGGVIPTCQAGIRCITLQDMVPGAYKLVWEVNGVIHWDAIPGVISEYEYFFTQSFRAPISLVYARAEP